jgi:CPA1 family monovalent cation:H+ antiporter
MQLFNTIAVLISLSAVFSFLNHRYLRLPLPISLVIISTVLAVLLMALGALGIYVGLEEMVASIDFNQTVLVGMLSFLLFAGALHVNLNDLWKNKVSIGAFATLGLVLSTAIVGGTVYLVFRALGPELPLIHCLLFGALISPTDPIAVLGILRKAGAPKRMTVRITGESLFNDGVGVVLFMTLLALASGGADVSAGSVAVLLLKEVVGGALVGLGLGWIAFQALKRVDEYVVEILITLALVAGGYALALNLHTSGPIAIVIAGLMIGNHGRRLAMSEKTREHLDMFWELVDEILNAVLFVLIGLEILVISLTWKNLLLGIIAIPVVLSARFLSVGVPVTFLRRVVEFSPRAVRVLTWGGLRGGISVALALAVPEGPARDVFLPMTYAVVLFSLVVQGLTIKRLVATDSPDPPSPPASAEAD